VAHINEKQNFPELRSYTCVHPTTSHFFSLLPIFLSNGGHFFEAMVWHFVKVPLSKSLKFIRLFYTINIVPDFRWDVILAGADLKAPSTTAQARLEYRIPA